LETLTVENLPDFTLAADERSIGVHFKNLLGQRAIRTIVGRGSHDDGKVEKLAQFRVSHDV
jgi:hypothetical protein